MAADSLEFLMAYAISFCLFTVSYGSLPVNTNCDELWEGNSDQLKISSATIRFTLLHREHPCSPTSSSPVDHPSPSNLSKYHSRARRLTGHLSSCPADEVNISGPIIANGVPWDYFSYVTQIQLGTPARKNSVLVDTGSSLPWVTCKSCSKGCDERVDSLFDPTSSSTYNWIWCESSLCDNVPGKCSQNLKSCFYNQTYEDNSMIQGIASTDRLIYGKGDTQVLVFGCSSYFSGLGGQYSGIIGLSANSISFFSQLSLGRYKAMSFCFPHPHNTGFLQFGQYERREDLHFTPLFIDGNDYYVHITGIFVGNSRLDFPSGLGNNKTMMRCLFDTGTPFTMLPSQLFERLTDALEERIRGLYRVHAWTGQRCYEREIFWNEEDVYVPNIRIEFGDSAKIMLVAEDLWFIEASGQVCLAFKRNAGSDVVLGSRHLMSVHTVVDMEKSTLGLRDQGCT